MGRRTNEPEAWHIVLDTKTNEIITYHPSAQPEFSTRTAKRRYDKLGTMSKKEDADDFRQYKEMGIKPDAVAFLGCEHVLKNAVSNGAHVHINKLMEMTMSVRKETGRICFGNCRSLERAPACETCFTSLPQTWNLCACVKCLIPEDVLAKYSGKNGYTSSTRDGRGEKKQKP